MKFIAWTAGAALALTAAILAYFQLSNYEVRQLQQQVSALEQQKQRLVEYAARLSAERRVAQVNILGQQAHPSGRIATTLLWQEIGRGGVLGRPVTLEVYGTQVYFEALVLKFEYAKVGEGDPERGTSLALFRRVFGDQQMPESAQPLGRECRPVLEEPEPTPALHDQLWARFWAIVDDPLLAAELGVRVAQIEAPAVPVHPGQVWEVTLEAAGGLNVRRLAARTETVDGERP